MFVHSSYFEMVFHLPHVQPQKWFPSSEQVCCLWKTFVKHRGARKLVQLLFSHIRNLCFLSSALFSRSLQSRSKPEDFPTTFPQVRADTAAPELNLQGVPTNSEHLNLLKLGELDELLINQWTLCPHVLVPAGLHFIRLTDEESLRVCFKQQAVFDGIEIIFNFVENEVIFLSVCYWEVIFGANSSQVLPKPPPELMQFLFKVYRALQICFPTDSFPISIFSCIPHLGFWNIHRHHICI